MVIKTFYFCVLMFYYSKQHCNGFIILIKTSFKEGFVAGVEENLI